jgi:hypothetical protein
MSETNTFRDLNPSFKYYSILANKSEEGRATSEDPEILPRLGTNSCY